MPVIGRLPGWVIDWRVLRPMRYATGGTILAARQALEHGLAINLGGGYHHAAAGWAGGFCVYADAPLAAKLLHDEGRVAKVLVVDLDAHQGNGTASLFQDWSWAAIFDLYERDNFPARKEPEDYPMPVGSGLTGAEYLEIVQETLPKALEASRPDLLIFNAGSDPFAQDPLAGFPIDQERPGRPRPDGRHHGPRAEHPGGHGTLRRLFCRIMEDPRRQHRGYLDPVRQRVTRL